MTKPTGKFSPEIRARAVRLVPEHEGAPPFRRQAILSVAPRIGCSAQTLNEWIKKTETDNGRPAGVPSDMAAKTKALERENRELRQGEEDQEPVQWTVSPTNDILRKGEPLERHWSERQWRARISPRRSSTAGRSHDRLHRRFGMVRHWFEDHAGRAEHGARPICRVLPIAPSTYYDHLARRRDPSRRSDRARRDDDLRPQIDRVFDENYRVYGVRKVWRQMRREGRDIARCTVARLMKDMDLQGGVRGKRPRTTIPDKAAPRPLDRVNREFRVPAPNMLWAGDFTCVATWQGFVPFGGMLEPVAHRPLTLRDRRLRPGSARPRTSGGSCLTVGRRVGGTAHAGFVLDALEQAVHQRRPGAGLVHHSDRGSQHLSIKDTERLAEAGIEPSVARRAYAAPPGPRSRLAVGDSDDNALAETVNGLFKADVIHRRGPWRSCEAVEFATLEWVGGFNDRRLLEHIGHIPPAEAEAACYAALEARDVAAQPTNTGLRQTWRGSD